MSALSLALLAQFTMSCPATSSLLPRQALERVAATAQAESGLNPIALHDNTSGQSYALQSAAEAAALATTLKVQGHSLDAGLMQINDANWQRLGLTAESVFDPRQNVCAGVAVLAEAYAIERRVSCRYNTGRPDCSNGYPERIESALSRVRVQGVPTATAPVHEGTAAPIPVDPFIGHGSVREIVFTPFYRPAVPPLSETRPAEPAVPENPIAAADRGRGELVTVRSAER